MEHILEWHRGIKYHLQVQGQSLEILASRGLRQGCLVAPLVWALIRGRFLYLLALATDPLWVAQDVTAYADDFHAGSQVQNTAGLDLLLQRLGCMLDVLHTAGLNINALKSAVLCRFKGNFAKLWMKQRTRTTPDGDLFRLRTPQGHLFEFPIVTVHTYLGTKISYLDPRTQTLQYRMKLAQVEWSRLRKLVCSKHGLFLTDRIRIWRSSVPATLLYGLAASGLPVGGLHTIRTLYMRQLRAIMRCPAHLSHLSNREVLRQAQLPDIAVILRQEMDRLAHNVQVLTEHDSVLVNARLLDFAGRLPDTLYQTQSVLGTWGTRTPTSPTYPEETHRLHRCRYCACYFPTHALCKAHEAKKHPQPQLPRPHLL